MPDKVLLRFEKRFAPYNPGETAGFETQEAQELVKRGVAVLLAMDEEGNLVPTKAALVVPSVVVAEQTAAGMFPPVQDATRAPTNNIDDSRVPAWGSEGSRPDIAMRAQNEQKGGEGEEPKPEPKPFIIPAVQLPPSEEVAVSADGPPPVESGTPEEAEKAKASKEAAEKAQENPESLLGGGEEQASAEGEEEPKKRGRPRKE